VHRDEKIRFVAVGNVCTSLKGDKNVGLSGVNHLNVRAILFDQSAECQSHIEVDVLFFGELSHCSGVFSAVSSVNDQHEGTFCCSVDR
jgi:hypothetical protein